MKLKRILALCGVTFGCLCAGASGFGLHVPAREAWALGSVDNISEIKSMRQTIALVDWEKRIYRLQYEIESESRQAEQIRIYAGEDFCFTDVDGNGLEKGVWVDMDGNPVEADGTGQNGQVCQSEEGWYILWDGPELGNWESHTLYIRASDDFAGGNNVTVGILGKSGVYLDQEGEKADIPFDTTTVNVHIGLTCEDKQLNVMKGLEVSDEALEDYAALYPSSLWGDVSDIPLAGQWYEVKDGQETAVGQEIRGSSYVLPAGYLESLTPASSYRLKLYSVGAVSTSQSRDNSGGYENVCSIKQPLASAEFAMKEIYGQIDLTVWLKQFPYKDEISTFAFELYQADGDNQAVTSENSVGVYEVVFDSKEEKRSESARITGLEAGWYTLVPLTPEGDYVELLEQRRDNQYPVAKTGNGAGINFHIGEVLPAESGYQMVNYLGQETGDTTSDIPVTVDYYYKETYYPVRYTANNPEGTILNGEAPEDATRYKAGDTVKVQGSGNMEVEGYVFAGWALTPGDGIYKEGEELYSDTDIKGTQVSDETVMPEDGLELYGRWIRVYKVAYDGNTATDGEAPVDDQGSAGGNTYYSDDTVTVKDAGSLVKTDADGTLYEFAGWNDRQDGNGNAYEPGDTFKIDKSDVTLYAQWIPVDTQSYAVSYILNLPEDLAIEGEIPADSRKYKTGEMVSVLDKGTLDLRHYIFAGWALTSSEDGLYVPGETLYRASQDEETGIKTESAVAMPENGLRLYSRWIPLYSVSYLANADGVEGVPAQEEYMEKEMVEVDDGSGLYREGYVFMGWNTRPDGSGQSYDSGLTFNMPAEDMVLYAQWDRVPEPETQEGTDQIKRPENDRGFIVTAVCLAGVAIVALYILWKWLRQKLDNRSK